MDRGGVEAVIRSLNEAGVRYLVAGGLAVVAHGFVRFTADVDLLLDMDEDNLRRAVAALARMDYRPRAPVPFSEFADAEKRREWVRDKGLTVFSVFSPRYPATEVDLFVESPLDFATAYAAAVRIDVAAAGITATVVGFDDLLRLKRRAGRPQDLVDIENLQTLRENAP